MNNDLQGYPRPTLAKLKQCAMTVIELQEAYGLRSIEFNAQGWSISLTASSTRLGVVETWNLGIYQSGTGEIFSGSPDILLEEVEMNTCPRCEQNPKVEGSYLCEECR